MEIGISAVVSNADIRASEWSNLNADWSCESQPPPPHSLLVFDLPINEDVNEWCQHSSIYSYLFTGPGIYVLLYYLRGKYLFTFFICTKALIILQVKFCCSVGFIVFSGLKKSYLHVTFLLALAISKILLVLCCFYDNLICRVIKDIKKFTHCTNLFSWLMPV